MSQEPQPISFNNAPQTPPKEGRISSLTLGITAMVFFIFGFLVAGLFEFTLTMDNELAETNRQSTQVASAVDATFIALTPTPQPTATTAPVELTFSQDDYIRGEEKTVVTIVEFSDYQCPYCGVFALNTLQPLLDEFGDQVTFVYRDYPIFGEKSFRAAHAAACAEEQDQFWAYHDQIFIGQAKNPPDPIDDTNLLLYATELAMDEEEFQACLANPTVLEAVTLNVQNAYNLIGNASTPTFLINGRRIVGAQPLDTFRQIVLSLIAQEEAS